MTGAADRRAPSGPQATPDPAEPTRALLRDLRSGTDGLSDREAARRQIVYGPNRLERRHRVAWPRELAAQLTHPLALLLWLAAALALLGSTAALAAAIFAVIILNALVAFAQERQAERAVEALASFLPERAHVLRDGTPVVVAATELVPGDVILLTAGDRVSADARLLRGAVDVDASTLTGESAPVTRSSAPAPPQPEKPGLLDRPDVVFSGTACVAGEATALVFATGMHTEIGRIAALSQRVGRQDSPLERQVKRVAWLIAAVAVGVGVAFLPIGTWLAGLPLADSATFAIGLLVANVPEGLLPTITLALAVGVRSLAGRGALVKRLSAVETLGSTTVICTDKTGTLTVNRMHVTGAWTASGAPDVSGVLAPVARVVTSLGTACAACNDAHVGDAGDAGETGDPTETALLRLAQHLGADVRDEWRRQHRVGHFPFDPTLRLMTTVTDVDGQRIIHTKGAPEDVLQLCTRLDEATGSRPLTAADRATVAETMTGYAQRGLRVLAVADRPLRDDEPVPADRGEAERDLTLLGLVALFDPPRPEVADAVARCHEAGIRMIVVTGDNGLTAAELARQVGIVGPEPTIVTGAELDRMTEPELDRLLGAEPELIFARSSPEAKLRIADALRSLGNVVAMTGDGVNDAPALRRADIGVAMGASGTDVAREAATMVLTDDNFATIVTAVEGGRRVYDNVRKFIVYIFAHATPEVIPFLVFALSGGRIPLPLTVLQILAIDLGTETLPALALGREPAEPGIMQRRPHPRGQGIIDRTMLLRSWLLLGGVSAVLVLVAFFATLTSGGWSLGTPTGAGTPLHHTWQQATTMTFLGIVACQIGTAMAARTQHSSLRAIGLLGNRLLLWGVAFEIAFAAALVTVPALEHLLGMATPSWWQLAILLPFPVIVWGADEIYRAARRHAARPTRPAEPLAAAT